MTDDQKTTTGIWGTGNILCGSCGKELVTEWVQKPGLPKPTARHKRCICFVARMRKMLDDLKQQALKAEAASKKGG